MNNETFARDSINSRRDFLRLMAGSLSVSGLAGCIRQPKETIVPSVQYPEYSPSETLQFATAMNRGGYALGVLATSHAGRPTKIEGNPRHPASLGATDVFAQASILDLYDPDRSQLVKHRGVIQTWDRFVNEFGAEAQRLQERRGAGLRILTGNITSPTLGDQLLQLLEEMPEARWHQYEPAGLNNVREGCRLAFGRYLQPQYHLERAKVVLALDADFLCDLPLSVRYAREFIDRRRVANDPPEMNRLYVVESTATITGAMADHRLPLRPSWIERFATALLGRVQEIEREAGEPTWPRAFFESLLADLRNSRGHSLIVPGIGQPAALHVVAWALNVALGNIGETVTFHEPVEARPENQGRSIGDLVEAMNGGEVETLVILGGNPAYGVPDALDFGPALDKVKSRVHLSLYEDETSFLCDWHLPAVHYLESWSDLRAYDGTATIVQPLIEPLYGGHSPHEVIALLRRRSGPSDYQIVQEYWRGRLTADGFPAAWRRSLHDGIVADTEAPEVRVELIASAAAPSSNSLGEFDVEWRPDATIWDGSFANNAWLQELPKPLTKITWDNAAHLSEKTAKRLKLASGDLVEITSDGRSVVAPVWITPGQADDCISLTLGYGRTRAGRVGNELGYRAGRIASTGGAWFASDVSVRKVVGGHRLATTQDHHRMEGRDIVRVLSLDELKTGGNPEAAGLSHAKQANDLPSFYPSHEYTGHAWGMAIDQTACIGCNACMVACQAENNVPVVGREQVEHGREMHWLRIDRYYEGPIENPTTLFQPMMCVHCEQAPCEVVCPVEATVHDSEGTNNMIYNRCVGTRYCSNNCPYKVRRFNYLQYTDTTTESLKLLRNPDVTVRSRGVMEKCTYCIQRISAARIDKKRERQALVDGDVTTACQQACPTRAIIFGDLNDEASEVRRLKALPLNYGVLAELNTRPRTTYLARVTNPHPDLAPRLD